LSKHNSSTETNVSKFEMSSALSHRSALFIKYIQYLTECFGWGKLEEDNKSNDGIILCVIKVNYIITMLK